MLFPPSLPRISERGKGIASAGECGSAFLITIVFSLIISLLVFFFAKPLMLIFVRPDEAEILRIGTEYLRIEGVFLFRHRNLVPPLWLLPGHPYAGNVCRAYHSVFRYTCRPFLLAGIHSHYWGSPVFGWSIPIGWFLADLAGIAYYHYRKYAVSRT